MASFTKIADFVEALPEKVHNLGADALTLALSNTAPASETPDPTTTGNGVLTNVTEIAYTNCSSRVLASVTSVESGGTYKLDAADHVLTASGGAVAQFRYIYIYNNTATNDELIGLYDYGSAVDLADGETLTIAFHADGILTIT
jgi:hypothetical protein